MKKKLKPTRKEEDKLKLGIVFEFAAFMRKMDKKYGLEDGYVEYIGIRLLTDHFGLRLGKKRLKEVLKECS